MSQLVAETVEVAERVHVTHKHDRYAAAILADAHLRRAGTLQPLTFQDEAERSRWRLAQNTLREAQRAARADPRMASGLDAYHERFERYAELLAALDGNPEAHVRRAKAALRQEEIVPPSAVCAIVAGLAPAVLALARSPLGIAVALLTVGALGASCGWWVQARRRMRQAHGEVRSAWARAHAYADFMDDPEGGQWLRLVWDRHPLLLEQAPRPAKPKSGVIRIQKIPSQEDARLRA